MRIRYSQKKHENQTKTKTSKKTVQNISRSITECRIKDRSKFIQKKKKSNQFKWNSYAGMTEAEKKKNKKKKKKVLYKKDGKKVQR